jgi:hypothetical protein
MRKRTDLTGHRIWHLTVLSQAPNRINARGKSLTRWWVQCDCGGEPFIVDTADLTSKNPTKTCGCGYQKVEYLEVNLYRSIAMREYHWLVPYGYMSRSFVRGQLRLLTTPPFWLCRCWGQNSARPYTSSRCERWVRVTSTDLRSGKVRSCPSCVSACKASTLALAKLWRAWEDEHGIPEHMQEKATRECYDSMISRYTHEKAYRERGVHAPWLGRGGFKQFLKDMGPRTRRGDTNHRTDNARGYHPDNCMWAPIEIQAREKTNSRILHVDGQSVNLVDFAAMLGRPMWYVSRWIERLMNAGHAEEGAIERILESRTVCSNPSLGLDKPSLMRELA